MVGLLKSHHHPPKCLRGNSGNLEAVDLVEAAEEGVVEAAGSATEEEEETFPVEAVTSIPEAATSIPEAATPTPAEATKPTKTEVTIITLRKASIVRAVLTTNTKITEVTTKEAMVVIKETLMITEVAMVTTIEVALVTIIEVAMVTTIGVVSMKIEVAVEGATTTIEEAVEGATTTTGAVAEVVIVRKIFNNRNELKLMILFKLRRPPMPISTYKKGSTINSILQGAITGILEAEAGRITIVEVEVVIVKFYID